MLLIDKYRFWDAKHQRWFQGHPDEYHRNLQTDSIHLFGEMMIMGDAYSDQNEDDVWKNDEDIRSSIDMLNYIQVVHCAQIQDVDKDWIFEGDILQLGENQLIVFWSNKELMWKVINIRNEGIFNLNACFMPKIIGNIYDNPEFLDTISDYTKHEELNSLPPRKLNKIEY